jgi:two-component system sensor kinase FixL
LTLRDWHGNPRAALIQAVVLVAVIAMVDWRVDLNLAFGFLYLFPMLLVGTALPRWQVVLAALFCTLLSDLFDPFRFTLGTALPEDILVFTSLAGTGLFAFEITRSRQREADNLRRVEAEAVARREAEEQLEFLIGSSPAAILTMDADGVILRANSAAHRLIGMPAGQLHGRNIASYLPSLARVPSWGVSPQAFRTEMQCRGERDNGTVFLANVFFSTYQTAVGPRLAALVVDASEELREREESNLEQLLAGSRILVGAVSHEVRNVCGAIAVIHENLVRNGALAGNKDFEALGSLVETLNAIAELELKQTAGGPEIHSVELGETLDDLRIVLEPYCEEAGITVSWEIPPDLPPVLADRHRLLQVLLNLIKNSERALEGAAVRMINIQVTVAREVASVRVTDSGPGIGSARQLFQPFQKGADSTGLGLYLSRAFVRSFHGDLRYDPAVPGCSFVIELAVAGDHRRLERRELDNQHLDNHGTHPTVAAR